MTAKPRAGRMACVAVLAATAALRPDESSAAVRLCKETVSSGPVSGSNEQTARAGALAIWKSKAQAYGEPYASWRIAADKILKCLPKDGSGFECLASARPCTIEQAPDRLELRQKRIGI